jgi:hypothetical protein
MTETATAPRCETCHFAKRTYQHQSSRLECRRHAPVRDVMIRENQSSLPGVNGEWPCVNYFDVCGDYVSETKND